MRLFLKQTAMRKISRNGFTVIELLVVVGIIGILSALLLPSLTRMKARAVQARCSGQLRQIYQGMMLYSGDNNQLYMPVNSLAPSATPPSPTPPGTWYWYLAGSPLADYLGGNVGLEKVVICPSNRTTTNTFLGTKGYPYVVNYNVMAQTGTLYPFKHFGDVTRPSMTIWMTDAITGTTWGAGFGSVTSGWNRVSASHLDEVNVLWCDGRVSSENKNNLTDTNVKL